MLQRLGFDNKWRSWIEGCLRSSQVSVLINGSPTSEFSPQRGLRQGDPLSPFLYVIVAEGLAGMMRSAVQKNLFTSYEVGAKRVAVNLLQFADDTIFFGEPTISNVITIKSLLRCFELVSGLKINFYKSCCGAIGSNLSDLIRYAMVLNCKIMDIPFKYLGLPIGDNPRRQSMWKPIILKFEKKLALWKNKLISLAGRVCGLGIKDISLFNKALLGKWRWSMFHNEKNLWGDILESKYGGWRDLTSGEDNNFQSYWWKDLRKVYGNKDEEQWRLQGLQFDSHKKDYWKWLPGNTQAYTVKSTYGELLSWKVGSEEVPFLKELWSLKIPPKEKILTWRMYFESLPTIDNLKMRNIQIAQNEERCRFCLEEIETTTHLFFHCSKVDQVWKLCYKWANFNTVLPANAIQHFQQLPGHSYKNKQASRWKIMWAAAVYNIWMTRNNNIFRGQEVDIQQLEQKIRFTTWSWLKMDKDFPFNYVQWESAPGVCITEDEG
uniref:LINE-1 reverse transcriptase isogeny n=1 Tax=Cajanus cajan TaxID=3821 RepID=A0A151T637_CAJCA|nr:LINE-1 reverse transcriptase isogeny [Cajanus cajan]